MPVEEQLATIFEVLEGGAEVPAGEIVQFPTDVAGAGSTLEGTTTTVELGNGIATEVSQLTVTEAGATTTAGVGLLALSVPEIAVAIGCCLGIAGGVGLYELAPEFWTNVSNKLLEAHQTVGGKVLAFINGDTKQIGVTKETIEIFKNAFLEAGIYDGITEVPEIPSANTSYTITTSLNFNSFVKLCISSINNYTPKSGVFNKTLILEKFNELILRIQEYGGIGNRNIFTASFYSDSDNEWGITLYFGEITLPSTSYTQNSNGGIAWYNYLTGCFLAQSTPYSITINPSNTYDNWMIGVQGVNRTPELPTLYVGSINATEENPNLQPDAIYPTVNPFPQTYPKWNPWSVPVEGFPDVYPLECPAINDNPDQSEAQNPEALPDDNPDLLPWFIETLPQPQPDPNPFPEPSVNPDPDPAPEPEPIPDPEPEPTPENPVDPNPTPSPSPLPVVPDMPDTVESNAMFTVYKPSMAQVNAFGGWLWSSSIVEAIKRIWQNPLDGIISFMKVYVNAPTSGSDTIKVGILDSEVSSPVVSGQFVTVECGSLNVKEKFYNATDYSPFVAMHLYLPFIGIVELDIDEFMSGEIKVTYHVDVYTGTCLAEVKSRRSPDMPEWTIVYTFSGNASQQLPLTSAEFSGALSSLVGVVGGGLAIASGGGLGLLAGASGIAHAVSHEMVHLAHSGSLSANAGIMGARKPYLILTRRRGYDANGYNELYGYPSNKTVYLNNCSGYVKVKDIRLETVATDSERIEIESLLKAGVII